jgi:hypothetical protein
MPSSRPTRSVGHPLYLFPVITTAMGSTVSLRLRSRPHTIASPPHSNLSPSPCILPAIASLYSTAGHRERGRGKRDVMERGGGLVSGCASVKHAKTTFILGTSGWVHGRAAGRTSCGASCGAARWAARWGSRRPCGGRADQRELHIALEIVSQGP